MPGVTKASKYFGPFLNFWWKFNHFFGESAFFIFQKLHQHPNYPQMRFTFLSCSKLKFVEQKKNEAFIGRVEKLSLSHCAVLKYKSREKSKIRCNVYACNFSRPLLRLFFRCRFMYSEFDIDYGPAGCVNEQTHTRLFPMTSLTNKHYSPLQNALLVKLKYRIANIANIFQNLYNQRLGEQGSSFDIS